MDRTRDFELQPCRLLTYRQHGYFKIKVIDVTFEMQQQARTVWRRLHCDQKHGLHDWIVTIIETKIDSSRHLSAKLFGFSVFLSIASGFEIDSRIDSVVFVEFSARFQHGRAQFLCRFFVSFHDLPVESYR